ncbi:helix-turn-helix transcriptional regulator [uncultured Corynebacterium sp.]|uniref:ArsR/SmtB family transcription factor n=1 Tax=uncultured Corynebacterium sp. TaxID=159447 RepID=UPI0025E49678|nr:winged helix-turn-helix domain-containing protein [uncultured Corynebacterium sp.]
MDDHLVSLNNAVAELTARVEALEAAPPTEKADHGPDNGSTDPFRALNGLKDRADAHGEVMLVGAATLPDGPVEWQESRDPSALLEADWTDHATTFAALGHPVRLELLRHILTGTHRTADLAAMDHLGTTGQLHHHLRQLVAAGWVRQSGRGSYEVPTARVIPLLACLTAAG